MVRERPLSPLGMMGSTLVHSRPLVPHLSGQWMLEIGPGPGMGLMKCCRVQHAAARAGLIVLRREELGGGLGAAAVVSGVLHGRGCLRTSHVWRSLADRSLAFRS